MTILLPIVLAAIASAQMATQEADVAQAALNHASGAQKPANADLNVILITIDTLRADHLGCYGDKQIKTPNIDALAADGTRFERAFSVVPVTLPSHSTMLTGTYPMLSGMHDFGVNKLSTTQPTMASVLKQRGYTTGAVVAAAVLDSRFGLNQGFDFYYDHFDFNRLDEANLDEMSRPGNIVADTALDWLGKNWQRKFFLWMHLYDPHFPYNPPEPYRTEYAGRLYDGGIAFADEQVGRLVRFLKDKGIYQNSIIVLAGDHGEGLGEHGEKTHGFFIYNSTMHVPLIFRVPGASHGKTVSDLASLVDLMPTVLEAVGVEIPAQVQGKSLLAQIRESETETAATRERTVYGETFLPRIHFNWSELRGAENARYHFIDAPKPELYDLATDAEEKHNLLGEKKAVGEEMRAKLVALIREYSAGKELAEKTGLDPALVERLKSLGYAAFSGGGDPTISSRDLPDPKDRIEAYEEFSDAMAASQHGRYQESIDDLKAMIKTEPNSVPAHYMQGLNYYRLKMYGDAVTELQKTVNLSPDYALAVFNLGMAQAHAGQIDEAIATLRRTLELDGTNFDAAFNLGVAYIQKRQLEQAADAFRKSVTIYPELARGHRALGETLLYLGKVDEAVVELRQAVELAPEEAPMHESLAKALDAKGLTIEAAAERERARRQQTSPQ
ncbi:MAG: sulfatase-like hydrolase/transferase [Terriglobales bacterium]